VIALGRCVRLADGLEDWEEEAAPEPVPPPPDPDAWAGGHRPLLLRLAWDSLTGRRVGGAHWPHPVVSGRGRGY
jgi:hypothetical protein